MASHLNVVLPGEAATLALGAALAAQARPGRVLHLSGELGAGKTTLVRGLLRALGHAGRVKSPTYALVELYAISGLSLYHFDFYRFSDPNEWLSSGFREAFNRKPCASSNGRNGPRVCCRRRTCRSHWNIRTS